MRIYKYWLTIIDCASFLFLSIIPYFTGTQSFFGFMDDTIAAISTPSGTGAIALIRLSGPQAWEIADSVIEWPGTKKTSKTFEANRTAYAWLLDGPRRIDEVMVTAFKAPKSYSGEDMIEISCHGSAYIQNEILNLLVRKGARLAHPGEFTQRAWLNGKLDLSQAEAVADLVASSGQASHRLALDQLRGGITQELDKIRADLLHFVTLIELELDFTEEDVEFADRTMLVKLLEQVLDRFTRLTSSFDLGNAVKSGVPVAIAGETNVGKSTLLNALLKEERAIVSELPGTTRDVIEDAIHIRGIEFRFVDTAGIRETQDTIETMGIERAYRQFEKARIVMALTDVTDPIDKSLKWIEQIEARIREDQHLIILLNKIDLVDDTDNPIIQSIEQSLIGNRHYKILPVSAKTGKGLDALEQHLLELINIKVLEDSDVIITNARHYEALVNARSALFRTLNGLHSGTSGDFLSQDIREALHYLSEITGVISSEEVLNSIFRNFCIGK